jgi:hypothetical protein
LGTHLLPLPQNVVGRRLFKIKFKSFFFIFALYFILLWYTQTYKRWRSSHCRCECLNVRLQIEMTLTLQGWLILAAVLLHYYHWCPRSQRLPVRYLVSSLLLAWQHSGLVSLLSTFFRLYLIYYQIKCLELVLRCLQYWYYCITHFNSTIKKACGKDTKWSNWPSQNDGQALITI